MKICLIAAIGKNFGIGHQGKLPWHLPEDFAWFKKQTSGKAIIMGRKTFESLGRPLPKRLNVVISRQPQQVFEGAIAWAHSLEDAVTLARIHPDYQHQDEIMIIGGGEIYSQAMAIADRLYLTEVDATPQADAFFPSFDKAKWQKTILAEHVMENTDGVNRPAFSIVQYDRL